MIAIVPQFPRMTSLAQVLDDVDAVDVSDAVTVLSSIIWTPSSSLLATMAYVLEPIVNVSTPYAPLSSSEPSESSILAIAEISEGVAANASGGNWKRSEDAVNNKMKK